MRHLMPQAISRLGFKIQFFPKFGNGIGRAFFVHCVYTQCWGVSNSAGPQLRKVGSTLRDVSEKLSFLVSRIPL